MFPKVPPQLNLEGNVVESPSELVLKPQEEVETVVGPSVHVEGDFASQGNIIVKGTVTGTVETSQLLIVEPGAKVFANVKARVARIGGEVKGDMHIQESLELLSSAKVLGDIETKLFSAEKGALFQGKMSMSDLVIQEPKQSARNSRLKSLGVKKNNGIPLER